MEFTASQVWGAACAAQRINGGYFKDDIWGPSDSGEDKKLKEANKAMVKKWLRDGNFSQITEEDYAAGEKARNHFKGYTLLMIAGKLNDFQQTAYKIASKDTFTGRDLYDFAVVSCLPSVAERDVQRNDLKKEIYASEQLIGNVGDVIHGDITVVGCRYNHNFNKFKVTARMGESFVDFWFGKELKGELRVKGKIKNVRGDKTTQLNYVKVVS